MWNQGQGLTGHGSTKKRTKQKIAPPRSLASKVLKSCFTCPCVTELCIGRMLAGAVVSQVKGCLMMMLVVLVVVVVIVVVSSSLVPVTPRFKSLQASVANSLRNMGIAEILVIHLDGYWIDYSGTK